MLRGRGIAVITKNTKKEAWSRLNTLALFDARLRCVYNDVCEELSAVQPEDFEYYVRLIDCADSLASLISFLKERTTAEVAAYD